MPRPRIDPEQEMYAYQCYAASGGTLSAKALVVALEEQFGREEAAGQRTVEKWRAGWKAKPIEADVPFEWHRMTEFELPCEAGAFLLRMRVFVLEGKDRFFIVGAVDQERRPVFSFRLAKWCWWVHLAAPDLCMLDVSWLANTCSFRELAQDLTGHPLNLDDITDYLGFRPWINKSHRTRYMEAVKSADSADTAPSGKHPLDFDAAELARKGLDRLFMEAVKHSNAQARRTRNPLLDSEPVQRALKELPVGYGDNPSFKSDGLLRSDWLASQLLGSDPHELNALVGWLPPEYLHEREEFGALSDEALHEHIRRGLQSV